MNRIWFPAFCLLRSTRQPTIRKHSFHRITFLTLIVALLTPTFAFAQGNPNEQQALKPYDSWNGGNIDKVSLTNGGLSFMIPLVDFPQRGSQDLQFSIQYSNKMWTVIPARFSSTGKQIAPAKWSPSLNAGIQVVSSVDWWVRTTYTLDTSTDLVDWSQNVSSPNGNVHQFANSLESSIKETYPMHSLDSTGLLRPDLYTVVLPNGIQLKYPTGSFNGNGSTLGLAVQPISSTDANGNQITIGSSGWTDTLGRVIPGSSANQPGVQPGVATTNLSSCPSGTASALIWNIPGFNNSTRTFLFCYSNITLQTSFNPGTTPTDYGPTSTSLLTAVVLPNLTMWTFTYDSFGDVTNISFPTGGSIAYTYAFGPPACDANTTQSMWVTSRTVNANDGTGGHQWTYSYVANGSLYSSNGTATVTDPLLNNTVHTIANPVSQADCSGYEVETQYYQGSSQSGTLLKTVQIQYTGTANSDATPTVATNLVPTQVKTTMPTGETITATMSHDLPTTEPSGDQFIVGSLLETVESDFSGFYRATLNQYRWQTNTNYFNATTNFTSLPSSTTIENSGGCEVAKTSYGYDETYGGITLQPSGISTQHVAAPAAVRGNQTSVSKYLVSQCSDGSPIVTRTVPYDTGKPYESIDGNQNVASTYSYSSAFAGAYLTQTQMPSTNGIQHIVSSNYDLNTGLMASSTDQNNNSTTFQYDNMLRPTMIGYPDLGETVYSYPSVATVDWESLLSSGVFDQHSVVFDGLGRPIETQHTTPSGTVLVDTAYDPVGRQTSVSNPYYSGSSHSSDPTYGVTQNQYDALNRVTKIIKQDGSFQSTDYTHPFCPIFTDEASNSRTVCSDSLGRTISVSEGTPGYVTLYQHDLLGNVLTVTQEGGSSNSSQYRNRTFSYDALSRLLSATNPESGTLSYTYDANNNLLTKVAPAPNQAGTTTLTTTYGYDALNRVTQKTYSDGTPTINYVYDASAAWGVSQANLIGRLSEIYESNTIRGDEIFSYDSMGRTVMNNQCTPANCGSGDWTVSASYNLAGDLTSLTYPSGRVVQYAYNSGDLLDQIQFASFNGTASNPPSYNYWAALDTNFYAGGQPKSWTLGNGITEATVLNSRLQVKEQTVSNSAIATFADHIYGYGSQDNGNVASVTDNLNSARTQTFTYDSLNRLLTANESRWGLAWVYDGWGNNLQQNVTSGSAFQHQYTATVNNQLSGFPYDAAGNMLNDGTNQYTYDAENRISSVNATAATYAYDAEGKRVKKTAGSNSIEYIRFGRNIIAEYNPSTGDWTDYIFSGARRIARALGLDNGLHIYGTVCGSCGNQYSLFYVQNAAGLANYAIRTSDKLNLTQYQYTGSHGGIVLGFTDGTNSSWNVKDSDGNFMNDDETQGYHVRRIDLSAYAGKTIQAIAFNQESDTAPGTFGIVYEQAALSSADGTVQPIYTGESSSPISSISSTSGVTGTGSQIDVNRNKAADALSETTYYHSNQARSSTMITAGNGWPVWQATFLPYGEEYNPELSDGEHYKFAGVERDSETGLNNFEARQDSSNFDRFMTPDWSARPMTVPYAKLNDPQSFNLYSYVRNNPVSRIDTNGHFDDPFGVLSSPFDAEDNNIALLSALPCNCETSYSRGVAVTFQIDDDLVIADTVTWAQLDAVANNNPPVGVSATVDGTTVAITFSDGHIEYRTGNHPGRDDNPGDIKAGGFASAEGAIGVDAAFAIFSSALDGWNALDDLLNTAGYQQLNIDQTIARFAPPSENDTAAYQASVSKQMGVSGTTPLSSLNLSQLLSLETAIGTVEGYFAGHVNVVIQLPQVANQIPQ